MKKIIGITLAAAYLGVLGFKMIEQVTKDPLTVCKKQCKWNIRTIVVFDNPGNSYHCECDNRTGNVLK